MKIPCLLENITDNKATLYDYKNHKEYMIELDNQDLDMYQDMLQEANEYDVSPIL